MGPSPLRKIASEVEETPEERRVLRAANDDTSRAYISRATTVEPTPRPRDAVIKAAANDNLAIRRVQAVNRPTPTRPTVDQEFSATYAEQGLQPSVGGPGNYANDNQLRSSGYSSPTRRAQTERGPNTRNTPPMRNTSVQKSLVSKDKLKNLTKAHNMNDVASALLPGEIGSYATAAEEASGLIPLTWGIWLALQVPLAIMCTVAFVVAGIFAEAQSAIRSTTIGDFLWNVGSYVVSGINGVLNTFLGFDLSVFDPNNFLLVFIAVTAFVVWAQMLIVALTYVFTGIPCLNGKGSVSKYCAVIAGLVGGALPILNFVPWATIWVLVVTANPTDDD